ncbi:MAG: GNAT family N-acetyltransferase [Candidatus Thorarchaeota archaeon]|nr:GNAT family N-acetyltransferase [Candidatus Thorarchaeota archaeon]
MYFGNLVCLRAVQESDFDLLVKYFNALEIRRFLGAPIPRSRVYLEDWIMKRGSSDPWKDGLLELSIADKYTDEFLGFVHLEDIKKPHNRAEMGISIHNPEHLSRGYGTDAIRVILWVGFNILGLHSIYLDTMEENARAIHVYEKVGFKRIGLFRESEFLDGRYTNLLFMDILRYEFQEANPEFTVQMKIQSP